MSTNCAGSESVIVWANYCSNHGGRLTNDGTVVWGLLLQLQLEQVIYVFCEERLTMSVRAMGLLVKLVVWYLHTGVKHWLQIYESFGVSTLSLHDHVSDTVRVSLGVYR